MNTTLISKISSALLLVGLVLPFGAAAQMGQSLSVSPTLFELSAVPGQAWQSSIKIVNSNPYELTVYAQSVNFAPRGEGGQGQFIPVFESVSEGQTLAEWITMTEETVTIPPETSEQIRFNVAVPNDASPGGHFAAILVGTKPPERSGEAMTMSTSQIVTSLFFLRVEGDVNEAGAIRSFVTESSFVSYPKVNFELRFENKGNVHLQPQGTIEIFNMWGSSRGEIPMNHQTQFGNVLPESIRKFKFSWEGEPSLVDIGRYKAVATLAYGSDNRRFETHATYFWVIPVKAVTLTVLSLVAFIWFVVWAVRAYVRHMLAMAGIDTARDSRRVIRRNPGDVDVRSYRTVAAPVRSGWSDLRDRLAKVAAVRDVFKVTVEFVRTYRTFFLGVLGVCVVLVLLTIVVRELGSEDAQYQVSIGDEETDVVNLNEEEVAFLKRHGASFASIVPAEPAYTLALINTSGETGTAGEVASMLVSKGFVPTSLAYNPDRKDKRSIVVFDPALQSNALAISEALGGALLSAQPANAITPGLIMVYVGADQRVAE